jgi:hypothetical protein
VASRARLAIAVATGLLGALAAFRNNQPPRPPPTMASSGGSHLGAAAGREVVFCHACQNEWFRTENDNLICPRCESSFTEIVGALAISSHLTLPYHPS